MNLKLVQFFFDPTEEPKGSFCPRAKARGGYTNL